MRLIKSLAVSALALGFSTQAVAKSCDIWGAARSTTQVKQFNLKELAAFVESRKFDDIQTCYSKGKLHTKVTMSPFEMDPYFGAMEINSWQSGSTAHMKVSVGGDTFEMKTFGERGEVLGNDGKWYPIQENLKAIETATKAFERLGPSPAASQIVKEASDKHLAPIGQSLLITGVASVTSSFGLLFGLQYAPLADQEGKRETVGGWDTSVWKVNNQKAELYAASRGLAIDTSGSYIRYWVTSDGLVVKVDAYLTPQLADNDKPVIFKYEVAKSGRPDG